MQDEADLRRLAEAMGVETGYWRIGAGFHEASPDSLRAILGALGTPAATASDVAAALEQIEDDARRETLAPVVVRQADEPQPWPPWPMRGEQAAARWRIELESGEVVSGDAPEARPPPLPPGYHRLILEWTGEVAQLSLIVAPRRCWTPEGPAGGARAWGVTAQLYGLRSERNWGVGDFGDLAALATWAGSKGAAVLGVSPLHALFPCDPSTVSPYYPASRLFLEPLYLEAAVTPAAAPDLAALRHADLIDYAAVASLKSRALEQAYARFLASAASGAPEAAEFREFRRQRGEALERFALFQALAEAHGSASWQDWPQAYRRPESAAAKAFARTHADRLAYHAYLQWRADRQLGETAAAAAAAGMEVGIYRDLAVGAAPGGAEVWAEPDLFAGGAEFGAPPDPFSDRGQAWGTPPMRPGALRASAYRHFIALMRANMRHAGALRIDHVMGLQRLFWIPAGAPPSEGVYVRYPADELLAVLRLESQRNRCLVVGEDLGTVPEGFRPRMEDAGVLSYRVLYFERDGETFRRPADYPRLAAACISTHDLPTLAGFWTGSDLAALQAAGRLDAPEDARAGRRRDKLRLLNALAGEALLEPDADLDALADAAMTPALAVAIHVFIARAGSLLALAQLEDLAGERAQANVPGTTREFPNWRRRLSRSLADLECDPLALAVIAAMAVERPMARPAA